MKLFLVLIILTTFSAYCDANTISRNALSPLAPGKCQHLGIFYTPGEHQIWGCTRLICSPKGWASVHTCVNTSIKGCIRGEVIDKKKPFPECCKREYTCQKDDGSEYTMTNF